MTADPDLILNVSRRFELLRPLGEGGMGVVFEAFDRERNARVALKTLKRLASRREGAQALLRFKREFRALQDLHHRNLVSLGELIAEGQQWFFTMELVEGVDFLAYVRPRAPMEADGVAVVEPARDERPSAVAEGEAPMQFFRFSADRLRAAVAPLDEARLRATLPQLASGLEALHAAGKVHRDIKPSNVRVTPAGRVVLLDFGLVAEVFERAPLDGGIAGTPAYMAPEQIGADAVGPAADWYALGVMLYEALAGRLPFDGAPVEVLRLKQRGATDPPSAHDARVPADLDALCMRLLATDPAARASGADVLRALEARDSRPPLPDLGRQARGAPFVGRASEIAALDGALADSRGGAAVVLVEGESGVGKTCLVRRFYDRVGAAHTDAVVLAGRCFERERVPYKGLDGVIDELAGFMAALPDERAAELLPARIGPLVQVFPVLRRASAFAFAVTEESRDPRELRRRAFEGLRAVLSRIAARRPLVIAIDDLQWADADSLSLLTELLRPPDAPALLLVATLRDAPADATMAGAPVAAADVESHLPCAVRRVTLQRLPDDEARALATSLLEAVAPHRAKDAGAIAREAQGHPLFIDELSRHAALVEDREIAGDAPEDTARMVRPTFDLEEALSTRIARLDDAARAVLEIVAVAGRPLAQETVARAAGMDMGAFARAAAQLRAAHLVLTGGARAADRIEPYHERVRAAVVARTSRPQRATYHRRLALALAAAPWPDQEALAVHWEKAGDRALAAKHAVAAAHQASEALAFDRAAACWESALRLTDPGDPKVRALRVRLADALANAGRGALAAPVYWKAAEGAEPTEALELRRRAAEQHLRAGRFDEGLSAVREVLALLGLAYPRSPLDALVQLVLLRVLLTLRGTRFTARDASHVPARDLMRVDVCWSVASSLGPSDHLFGAAFQARAVHLALRAGEPTRVARALATAAGHQAAAGSRVARRVERRLARAHALAEATGDPRSLAHVVASSAIAHSLTGHFRLALEDCDRAAALFHDRVPGTAWEQATMHHFALVNLACMGRIAELQRRQPLYLRDAVDRGDVHGAVGLTVGWGSLVWLARDDPEGARREVDAAMQSWSRGGVHLEHFYELGSRTNADLYAGRAREALERADRRIAEMRQARLLRIEAVRVGCAEMHARCALAVAEREPGARPALLRAVDADVATLSRGGAAWALPLARLHGAAAAHLRGDGPRAIRFLRDAIDGFHSADMGLHEAAARRRLAARVQGDEAASLRAASDAWMKEQGAARPDALMAMAAPGL